MAALCDESVEGHQLADPANDTGQNSWNGIQTRMLISQFKENAILWDKRLKENGNKAKQRKQWHHWQPNSETHSHWEA